MSSSAFILALRIGGAVLASAVFGLIAAGGFPPWNFWVAFGLGFLFGTAFMVGTGYRILIAVALQRMEPAPVSWSGATAGVCVMALPIVGLAAMQGQDTSFVLLAFGIAINFAYLPIKSACLKVGCCQAVRPFALSDLRLFEIGLSIAVLVVAAALGLAGWTKPAAVFAIGGHLCIRLLSRRMRNRWSWGWPPFTQPGAELAPLLAVTVIALLP